MSPERAASSQLPRWVTLPSLQSVPALTGSARTRPPRPCRAGTLPATLSCLDRVPLLPLCDRPYHLLLLFFFLN